jgi:chemotaxis protein CheD
MDQDSVISYGALDDVTDVVTGEVKIRHENGVLRSLAIGSCIAVVCYDKELKFGIVAHIMLPGKAPEGTKVTYKLRYAENAIKFISELLYKNGSSPERVDICIVGGGNVLKKENDTICKQNINSVNSILSREKFRIKARKTGGYERKSVRLNVGTGEVYYTIGDENEKPL